MPKTNFLYLLLFAIILGSCHKYSEDSFISLRKPGNRLNGTWKFIGYRINGVDHNHDFDSVLAPKTLTDCSIKFIKNNNNSNFGLYKIYDNEGREILPTDYREYSLVDGQPLTIHYIDSVIFYNKLWKGNKAGSPGAQTSYWGIRELYNKELHLTFSGIDIYFKKQ